MKTISNETHDEERAFYNTKNTEFLKCTFQGPQDGESALKEGRNIVVNGCEFHLRYPLWHNHEIIIQNSTLYNTSRAPLWYSKNVVIQNCHLLSPKALRECSKIQIHNSNIDSEEFGWMCKDLQIYNTKLNTNYAFFRTQNVTIQQLHFTGKYSFQYMKNVAIEDSVLDTKDAFWHSKNVTIKNSVVKGEYLAWYSENLTFENCEILGTQPFCYSRNLTLINCTMKDCDLAFEYSSVNADIHGNMISIKNPMSGTIVVDSVDNIIQDHAVKKCHATIITRTK